MGISLDIPTVNKDFAKKMQKIGINETGQEKK